MPPLQMAKEREAQGIRQSLITSLGGERSARFLQTLAEILAPAAGATGMATGLMERPQAPLPPVQMETPFSELAPPFMTEMMQLGAKVATPSAFGVAGTLLPLMLGRTPKIQRVISGKGSNRVTIFHGTTSEAAEQIHKTQKIHGPAFFSPLQESAKEFGEEIVAVDVPKELLRIDFDLPGGKLLDVDDANRFTGNKNWTIDDYIRSGTSVGIEEDIFLSKP